MPQPLQNPSVSGTDRRAGDQLPAAELRKLLNLDQLAALSSLERFGWYLKFVRSNPPRPPVAVLCDPDAHRFAILDEQGELQENPVFDKFRQ